MYVCDTVFTGIVFVVIYSLKVKNLVGGGSTLDYHKQIALFSQFENHIYINILTTEVSTRINMKKNAVLIPFQN